MFLYKMKSGRQAQVDSKYIIPQEGFPSDERLIDLDKYVESGLMIREEDKEQPFPVMETDSSKVDVVVEKEIVGNKEIKKKGKQLLVVCQVCNKEMSKASIARHVTATHKMNYKKYLDEYDDIHYNG